MDRTCIALAAQTALMALFGCAIAPTEPAQEGSLGDDPQRDRVEVCTGKEVTLDDGRWVLQPGTTCRFRPRLANDQNDEVGRQLAFILHGFNLHFGEDKSISISGVGLPFSISTKEHIQRTEQQQQQLRKCLETGRECHFEGVAVGGGVVIVNGNCVSGDCLFRECTRREDGIFCGPYRSEEVRIVRGDGKLRVVVGEHTAQVEASGWPPANP